MYVFIYCHWFLNQSQCNMDVFISNLVNHTVEWVLLYLWSCNQLIHNGLGADSWRQYRKCNCGDKLQDRFISTIRLPFSDIVTSLYWIGPHVLFRWLSQYTFNTSKRQTWLPDSTMGTNLCQMVLACPRGAAVTHGLGNDTVMSS